MIIGFVLFIIILLLLYIVRVNIKKFRLIVDHSFLLILGFIYYWYLPFIPYEMEDINNVILSLDVVELYEHVSLEAKICYLVTSSLLIVSFILGEIIFKKKTHQWNFLKKEFNFSKVSMDLFFYGLVIFGTISLKYMLPVLFRGYSAVSEWPLQRGWFISVNVALIVLFCINASFEMEHMEKSGWKQKLSKFFLNKYLIVSLLFGFLMYSTGNRGYLTLSIISILLVLQRIFKSFKLTAVMLCIIILAIANAVWGHIRAQNPITFYKIVQSLFMEPGYVGMTLVSHLTENELQLFQFPTPLLSNLVGIIPSIIFPDKFKYIHAANEVGNSIRSFQGTTHNYVELIVNFGLIGAMMFMFFLSLSLNFLKRNKSFSGVYIAICSFLPFFFFRDLPNTLIKYILEFTIILSVLLYYSNLMVQKVMKRILPNRE
ncbi:hypothetical protein [Leptospira alstonii]|uniref:Membrane protein n=2 Tax=Leptospira alstonii TaxID=28452 RepID=T0FR73_9LEPT|nr:hypothetical protein [Leptospira alstonii]EMJ96561.1 putative membrane protein [Leptospira alstonii serovar Sichuan str. 79601]EQA80190.1 putative membrane protein [Leptospira alstonii serovar Pingchang str. 80-412]